MARPKNINIEDRDIFNPVNIEKKITVQEYLSNFSKNRDLDKTFIVWCRNNQYFNKSKDEWDGVFKCFFEETE